MLTQPLNPDLPLSRHMVLDTRSPDEARDVIGKIFCPHFLNPAGRRSLNFHARHHSVRQAGYSVNYVLYGSEVEIDPGELSQFFLLQVPVKGNANVRCGTSLAEVQAGKTASLLSPSLPTRMTWNEGCEKLIILIRRDVMENQFAALADRPCRAIEFAAGIDLGSAAGRVLGHHVGLMLGAADDLAAMPEAYQVMLRDSLTTLLLTSFPHSQQALFQRPSLPSAPASVRCAEEFIAEHAERDISMSDIASAAGVCLRSLQEAFKRSRGLTLTEAVQNTRLENFRKALLDRDAPHSVADLALASGLGHLGRAAAVYRSRYGETPSETLKRRR
jgi:AraC-like DNA-binding protein